MILNCYNHVLQGALEPKRLYVHSIPLHVGIEPAKLLSVKLLRVRNFKFCSGLRQRVKGPVRGEIGFSPKINVFKTLTLASRHTISIIASRILNPVTVPPPFQGRCEMLTRD